MKFSAYDELKLLLSAKLEQIDMVAYAGRLCRMDGNNELR